RRASGQTSPSWWPTPAGSICPPALTPVAWKMPRTLWKGSYGHDGAWLSAHTREAAAEAAALDGRRGHDPHVRRAAVPRRTDRPADGRQAGQQRHQAADHRRPGGDLLAPVL